MVEPGAAPAANHRLAVRVYYEDTDAAGVVYYANYLKYLERARTEWLRALGHDQRDLVATRGVLFAVRSLAIDYRAPARLDDVLEVGLTVTAIGRASIEFDQAMTRAADARVLVTARVGIACLDAAGFRPAPIPPDLRESLGRGN